MGKGRGKEEKREGREGEGKGEGRGRTFGACLFIFYRATLCVARYLL